MKNGYTSPSSSPPTPSSPLPVSVGPGCQKYLFSSSPSPSPPFSPSPSNRMSAINLPLLLDQLSIPARAPLAFSVDQRDPDEFESESSCLKDLLEWMVIRCCRCRSWSL